MPRYYRQAPLNAIWEGSGNVMCLDVLRAMRREPETLPAFMRELEAARGHDKNYDQQLDAFHDEIGQMDDIEVRARHVVSMAAKLFQASVLITHASNAVSEAFCMARLQDHGTYGTLPASVDFGALIERAAPKVDQ